MCSQYRELFLGDYYAGEGRVENSPHDPALFEPHMKYLGRVVRSVVYNDKVRKDRFVAEWMAQAHFRFEEKYHMVRPRSRHMAPSIAKYNRGQPDLNPLYMSMSYDWTERHFRPFLSGSRVLGWGPCETAADKTTSAGYPWSLYYVNKGDFMRSAEWPKVREKFWAALATDSPCVQFWTASLKNGELKPAEKLEKPRTFTANSTEGSTSTNRLCLDMNEKFYRSNNKTWSFVGCSKYNQGFEKLYNRLGIHPHAFALDESAFDASLAREFMYGQRDLRWQFLREFDKTPENKKRLWNIYDQIVNSVIVLDNGEVYQKNTGNPSGSANTIVDNTMILFRLMAKAWISLSRKHAPETCSYASFIAFVEAAMNGDDNTFTVASKVVGWFNAKSISEEWTKDGVTTRTEVWEPRELIEVDFLSHNFTTVMGRILPVPERAKVWASALWGNKLNDVRFTLLRLYALRIESWADPVIRKDLADCISYLERTYAFDLQGRIPDTDLYWKNVKCVWKTDREIWDLYTLPEMVEIAEMRCVDTWLSKLGKLVPEMLYARAVMETGLNSNTRTTGEKYVVRAFQLHCQQQNMSKKSKERRKAKRAAKFGKAEVVIVNNKPRARGPKGPGKKSKKGKKKGKGATLNVGGSMSQVRNFSVPASTGYSGKVSIQHKPITIGKRVFLGRMTADAAGAFKLWRRVCLNPGVPPTGPSTVQPDINDGIDTWLSNIAKNWVWHRPKKVLLIMKNVCNNVTTGDYGATTVHEAKKPPILALDKAMAYDGTDYGTAWHSRTHNCLGKNASHAWKYVRTGTPPGVVVSSTLTDAESYDLDQFDHGFVNIWNMCKPGGTANAGDVCDVHMELEWELKEPNSDALTEEVVGTVYAGSVWELDTAKTFTPGQGSGGGGLVMPTTFDDSSWKEDTDNTLPCTFVKTLNTTSDLKYSVKPDRPGFYLAISTVTSRRDDAVWNFFSDGVGTGVDNPARPAGEMKLLGGAAAYDLFLDASTGTTSKPMTGGDAVNSSLPSLSTTFWTTVTNILAFESKNSSTDGLEWHMTTDNQYSYVQTVNSGSVYWGCTLVMAQLPPALSLAMRRVKALKKMGQNAEMKQELSDLRKQIKELAAEVGRSRMQSAAVSDDEFEKVRRLSDQKDVKSELKTSDGKAVPSGVVKVRSTFSETLKRRLKEEEGALAARASGLKVVAAVSKDPVATPKDKDQGKANTKVSSLSS